MQENFLVEIISPDKSVLKRKTTGAAIKVIGDLIESQGSGQKFEIIVSNLKVLGECDSEEFPWMSSVEIRKRFQTKHYAFIFVSNCEDEAF